MALLQLTYLYVFIVSFTGSYVSKWYLRRLCAACFIGCRVLGAMSLILGWFAWVSSRAESEADRQWVADHDGGLLIRLVRCAMGAPLCALAHGHSHAVPMTIRRRHALLTPNGCDRCFLAFAEQDPAHRSAWVDWMNLGWPAR